MTPDEQNPFVGLFDAARDTREFGKTIDRVKRELEPAAKTFALVWETLSELQRQSELIDRAGFVPHTTMPQNLIRQSSGDPTRLSELLEHYYEKNWHKVRHEMTARVKGAAAAGSDYR